MMNLYRLHLCVTCSEKVRHNLEGTLKALCSFSWNRLNRFNIGNIKRLQRSTVSNKVTKQRCANVILNHNY